MWKIQYVSRYNLLLQLSRFILDVENLRVSADGNVIVFFTDKTRFEYHTGSRLWREISPEIELCERDVASNVEKFTVATTSGQKIGASGLQLMPDGLSEAVKDSTSSLVDLIGKLDSSAKRSI